MNPSHTQPPASANWTTVRSQGDFRARQSDEGQTPWGRFEVSSRLPVHPVVISGLIRESRESGLAGDLARWEVQDVSPFDRRILYVSRLPGPLRNRSFQVTQHFQLAPDAPAPLPMLQISSRDLDPAERGPDPHGTWPGRVCTSDYRIRPIQTDEGLHTALDRQIELDLDLGWIPPRLGRTLLLGRLWSDHRRLAAAKTIDAADALNRWYVGQEAFYGALRSAWLPDIQTSEVCP